MAIAGLDGFLDGIHLCLWILPGTESESWNFGSGVELVSRARHDSYDDVCLLSRVCDGFDDIVCYGRAFSDCLCL